MPRKNLEIKKKRKHYTDHLVLGDRDSHELFEPLLDGKAHFGDPRPGVRERRKSGRNRREVASEDEIRKIKAQMAKDEAEEKARQKKNAKEAKKKPKKKQGRKGLSIKRRGK
jgi:hypothetical protein